MSRSAPGVIKVALGILLNAQQQVLVSLRPQTAPHPGLWEFPGGKFELGETPLEALTRELHEEIGVQVVSASHLMTVEHDYGMMHVALNAWIVEQYTGIPYGREGQLVRWVTLTELLPLTFPEGNYKILKVVAERMQASLSNAD